LRSRALGPVRGVSDTIDDLPIDQTSREDLRRLLQQYLQGIEAKADEIRPRAAKLTYQEIQDLARTLSYPESEELDRWGKAHPDAWRVMQLDVHRNEAVLTALASQEPEQLVELALKAGLETKRAGQARKIVTEARASLEKSNQAAQKSIQEAGRLAPDQQQIEIALIESEAQMTLIRAGRDVRAKFHAVLTTEQRHVFDNLLAEMSPQNPS
jgi:hypothetical protein